ncbi:hypothetical protein Tco_0842302 [Tanacetum coccineum]|uniref:Uncharacterized protein n=1 Tax=Tanacetum coccineum TaxID=301880 RepID=A0ABQ5AZF9_9ASTR
MKDVGGYNQKGNIPRKIGNHVPMEPLSLHGRIVGEGPTDWFPGIDPKKTTEKHRPDQAKEKPSCFRIDKKSLRPDRETNAGGVTLGTEYAQGPSPLERDVRLGKSRQAEPVDRCLTFSGWC